MKLAQDIYNKLVNKRVVTRSPYANVCDDKWKTQILAALYLVINGKGRLCLYPGMGPQYSVVVQDGDFHKDFTFYLNKSE